MKVLVFASANYHGWLWEDLAVALAGRGHTVHVVANYHLGTRTSSPTPRRITMTRLPPYSLGRSAIARAASHAVRLAALNCTVIKLRSLGHSYDVVVYSSIATLTGFAPNFARRIGLTQKTICFLWDFFPGHHAAINSLPVNRFQAVLRGVEGLAVRSADHVAYMSSQGANYGRQYFGVSPGQELIVPPWGPEVSPSRGGARPSPFTVMFGGQLVQGRGIQHIIEGCVLANALGADISFKLAGAGPMESEYVALGAKLLGSRFLFLGKLSREDYLKELATASIGVAATDARVDSPSFPSKIVDYCRAGLPVVAALERGNDVGSWLESAGLGVAVAAGDVEGMATALLALFKEWVKDGLVGRSMASSDFYANVLAAGNVCREIEQVIRHSPGDRAGC